MGNACDRRDRRYRFELPATILSRRDAVTAVTENVSYRGVFLLTTAKVAKRELIRVRFSLPNDGGEIVANAMVVYVVGANDADGRPQGLGLQFYGLDGQPRARWEKLVASVREQSSDEVSRVVALPGTPEAVATRPELPVRVATRAALERFIALDLARMLVIRTNEAFAVGSELTLRLVHPDHGGTFALNCVVRHRMFGTHAGVGVELLVVNDAIRAALAEFVQPADYEEVEVEWSDADESVSVVRTRSIALSA
jgi:hypothetical protein